MPRYYFHIHDGMSLPDKEGTEPADLDAAKAEAIKLAAGVLRNGYADVFWNGTSWRLDVTDSPEAGGPAFVVLISSLQSRTGSHDARPVRAPHMKSADWLFTISFAFLAIAILMVLRIPWSWIG